MKKVFVCLFLFASLLQATSERPQDQRESYFPLSRQVTYQYIQKGMDTGIVDVILQGDILVNYFNNGEILHVGTRGTSLLVADDGTFVSLYDFSAARPWSIPSTVLQDLPCVASSTLALVERDFTVEVAAGVFQHCIRVLWDTPCQDAGILEEIFAPGVGLIKRVEARFYGVSTWELLSASLDGNLRGPDNLDFSCSIFPYDMEESLQILCSIAAGERDVELSYPSAQLYDLLLVDEEGTVVFRWSEGMGFASVVTDIDVSPNRPLTFSEKVRLPEELPAGLYWVEVILPVQAIDGVAVRKSPSIRLWIVNH